jgi:hypothetical protein
MNDLLAPVREVVRKHRPNPILDVQIEYHAYADSNERGAFTVFDLLSFPAFGRDVVGWLKPETLKDLESVLKRAMQEQAQESRDEARIEAAR